MDQPLPERLRQVGQDQLLAFWDELDEPARGGLTAQIGRIDFDLLRCLGSDGQKPQAWADLAGRVEAPPAIRLADRHGSRAAEARERGWRRCGPASWA